MTDPDPGLVEAVALQHHSQDCPRGLKPLAECSQAHRQRDTGWARNFLTGLGESGLYLTTNKEN